MNHKNRLLVIRSVFQFEKLCNLIHFPFPKKASHQTALNES